VSDLLARLAARAIGAHHPGVSSEPRRAPDMAETPPAAKAGAEVEAVAGAEVGAEVEAGAADGWRRTLSEVDGREGRGRGRGGDGAARGPARVDEPGSVHVLPSRRARTTAPGYHGDTGAPAGATGSMAPATSRGSGEGAGRVPGGDLGGHAGRDAGVDTADVQGGTRPSRATVRQGASHPNGAGEEPRSGTPDAPAYASERPVAVRGRPRSREVADTVGLTRDVDGRDDAPAPVVQVHIGRVDVRPTAAAQRGAGRQPASTKPGSSSASPLSLSDYLHGQREPR